MAWHDFLWKRNRAPVPVAAPARRSVWQHSMAALAAAFGSWGQLKAADAGRLMADAPVFPIPAEWIIRQHHRTVVARARHASINNDYARAYMRLCRQNIVGHHGIRYQPQVKQANGKLNRNANEAILEAWCDWGKRRNCDVAGIKSWRQVQEAAVNSLIRNGEYMIHIVQGREFGKYGLQLQVLDPQRCNPIFDKFGLPGGNFIRSGIEFTRYGKPVAYYFQDDAENAAWNAYQFEGSSYTRIPAAEIVHGFLPEMEGQKRGLPWLLTALWRLHQMGAYEDAAVVNARAGAAKMGIGRWDPDSPGLELDEDTDPSQLSFDMEAGSFLIPPKGLSFDKFDPGYPAGEFALFRKEMLRGMASGGGVLYNELANDLEGVNFSSIRQGTLDVRENWKSLQQWMIESLCEPVLEAWLARCLLAGLIRDRTGKPLAVERIDTWSDGAWQPRRWQWIDPLKDMEATVRQKNNLATSPSEIIREQGGDPQHVWAQFAQDIRDMQAAGIPDEFIKASLLPEQWKINVNEPAGGADSDAGTEANPDSPKGSNP